MFYPGKGNRVVDGGCWDKVSWGALVSKHLRFFIMAMCRSCKMQQRRRLRQSTALAHAEHAIAATTIIKWKNLEKLEQGVPSKNGRRRFSNLSTSNTVNRHQVRGLEGFAA